MYLNKVILYNLWQACKEIKTNYKIRFKQYLVDKHISFTFVDLNKLNFFLVREHILSGHFIIR